MIELICKKCGEVHNFEEKDIEGFVNWKCTECYNMNMIKPMAMVKWNTDPGTAPRRG